MNNRNRHFLLIGIALLAAACASSDSVASSSPTNPTVVTTTTAPATTTTEVTSTTAVAGPVDVQLRAAGSGPVGTLTLSMPEGWSNLGWAVGKGSPDFPMFVSYWYVENVYGDRCNSAGALLDPAPGPTVDDLAAAFVEAWGPYATAPVDAELGGYSGQHMVLTIPTPSADCPNVNLNGWTEMGAPGVASRTYPSPGAIEEIWILDVGGVRQLISSAYRGDTSAADGAEQQAMIDSIRIAPAPE